MMKWILAIFLLVSFASFGQDDSTKYIWYKFQYGQRQPRGWFDSTAQMPYRDTNYTPARPGALVMRPQDKQFYKWNGTAWSIIASGGGGGSVDTINYIATKTNLKDTATLLRSLIGTGGSSLVKQNLTDASTTTWNISNGKAAEWTIGGNRTLSITNAGSSPWEGYVKVIQGSGGNHVPSLPGKADDIVWRLNIGDTNQLFVYYDGANYTWASAFSMNTSTGTQLADPENFSVTPMSTSSNAMTWDAVPNATSYQLQRANAINFRSGLTTVYSGSNTYFTETGLTPGQYFYRVKATAPGYQASRNAYAEPLLNTTMKMKIQPQIGRLAVLGTASYEIGAISGQSAVLEPSVVVEADTQKLFVTGSTGDQDHKIVGYYRVHPDSPFRKFASNPLIGDGLGGAPSGRLASSSCVIKVGSTYYCWALNGYGFPGDDGQVYQYKSVNGGHTWTSVGLAFAATGPVLRFGNTTIYPTPVGGTYYGVADVWTGTLWKTVKVTATNIEGPWTVSTTFLDDMQPVTGGMYGGGYLYRTSDGTWHYLYHYGTQAGNLPTSLSYARSTNNLDSWTIVETNFLTYYSNDPSPPMPPAEANMPYPKTDQIADIYLNEYNGKTYIFAEYGDNSYDSGNVLFAIYQWTYDGTIEQFFNVLPTFTP